MPNDFRDSALMKYIKKKNPSYHQKVLDVRTAISRWLSYVPQTFPHYPSHTIEHSDQIVWQLSQLLFENDKLKPTANLSSIEVYILLVSAYLHDAGMVISDNEKANLLKSNEWKQFISSEKIREERLNKIAEFRGNAINIEENLRNFLADVQLRFLIAEFVRKTHHSRSGAIIEQHEFALSSFSLEDSLLKTTIRDVCVAHGLSQNELTDKIRYPEERTIQNETANVRFIAILLRIGDLLDMSSDRACPLLLNAASPIPADSLAQWTKYKRFTHFLVTPEKIELSASCLDQNEHRFLEDWCQWLVDEIREAGIIMNRAPLHQEWRPPKIGMDEKEATIIIMPDPDANYIPSKWKYRLDEKAIIERLISDAYDHPFAFLRELLQNALDATRCQVYLDLKEKDITIPEFPTKIDANLRNNYPIKISLTTSTLRNELSGADEEYQVLSIEDQGTGMDKHVIENHFLQIGQSYYNTDEFRKAFSFIPSSRFGVGFLSVFAVSSNIVIDTYKPSSMAKDGPVKLILFGPRNYILLEKGSRTVSGTRIEIQLRSKIKPGDLTEAVKYWCRRVEFPISVNDLGHEISIRSEQRKEKEFEICIPGRQKDIVRLRAYPIEAYGIEGEFYILSITEKGIERWDMEYWIANDYQREHPNATTLDIPESELSVNGIVIEMNTRHFGRNIFVRADIRKQISRMSLSRTRINYSIEKQLSLEIRPSIEKVLLEHLEKSKLATLKDGWKYKNQLVGEILNFDYWTSVKAMIPTSKKGYKQLLSVVEVISEQVVGIITNSMHVYDRTKTKTATPPLELNSINYSLISFEDIESIERILLSEIFKNRKVISASYTTDGNFVLSWKKIDETNGSRTYSQKWSFFEHYNVNLSAICIDAREVEQVVFNSRSHLGKWLTLLKDACEKGKNGLKLEQYFTTTEIICHAIRFYSIPDARDKCRQYLKDWREMENLPRELKPPLKLIKRGSIIDVQYGAKRFSRLILGKRRYITKNS